MPVRHTILYRHKKHWLQQSLYKYFESVVTRHKMHSSYIQQRQNDATLSESASTALTLPQPTAEIRQSDCMVKT